MFVIIYLIFINIIKCFFKVFSFLNQVKESFLMNCMIKFLQPSVYGNRRREEDAGAGGLHCWATPTERDPAEVVKVKTVFYHICNLKGKSDTFIKFLSQNGVATVKGATLN